MIGSVLMQASTLLFSLSDTSNGSSWGVSEPRNFLAKLDEPSGALGLFREKSLFRLKWVLNRLSFSGLDMSLLDLDARLDVTVLRVSEYDLGLVEVGFGIIFCSSSVSDADVFSLLLGSILACRLLIKLPMFSFKFGSSDAWLIVFLVKNGLLFRCKADGFKLAWSRLWVDLDLQKASKRSKAALTYGSSSPLLVLFSGLKFDAFEA
jgi:hypothetical protein